MDAADDGEADTAAPMLPQMLVAVLLRTPALHLPQPPPHTASGGNREMTEQDPLVCITHQLPDFRGCTIRGEHYTDLLDADPDHEDTCPGCLPRRAHVGFVCAPCFARIDEAVSTWKVWGKMLDGVDSAKTRDGDGGRGKPTSRPPLAALALDREEVESYLRTWTGTDERWVASVAGAADAVRFARAMGAAARNHPTHETPHRIRRTRCPACEQLALVWTPPAYFGGHVTVTCRSCPFTADQSSFEKIATIEKKAANA